MIRKRIFFIFLFFVSFLLLNSFSSWAQTQGEKPVVFDGDRVEYSEAHKTVHGIGNCVLTYQDVKLTADKVAFDVESKEAVAEGNVYIYKDESIFKGKYGHYDFNTGKARISDVTFVSEAIYGAAERLDKVGEKKFVGTQSYFTTCQFEKPHYRLQTKQLKIYLDDKIVTKHPIFFIGDFPFLYLPYYSYSLRDDRPRVTVMPGHSKEWGSFLLTSWRYYFNDNFMGRIHLDWREDKGMAEGFTHDYDTKKFGEGTFHGYYMQERLRDIPEGLKAEDERFRIRLVHEWEPDDTRRAFLEYNRQSDQYFNEDYFYREYAKERQPESHVSLTKKYPNYSLNLYSRFRVNQFETVIQRLPEFTFDFFNYQLGESKFYFTNKIGLAILNKKTANSGSAGGHQYFYTTHTHTNRVDTYNKLSYPTNLPGFFKWLNFTPYADFRETFYSRNASGAKRNLFRNVYGAGYDLTTKAFRIWDVKKDICGIKVNKLRHLITPTISYAYRHDPSVPVHTLEQFDSVDAINTTKVYTLGLNNKLQTKWTSEEEEDLETVSLVDFNTWVYLHPQREGRNFSDVFFSLDIMPFRSMLLKSSTAYNWVTRDFEAFNLTFNFSNPRWEIDTGHRFIANNYSESTFRAIYNLSDKWRVGLYERYDFTRQRLNEQEYFFARDVHDWIIEVTWNITEDETIMLVFRNKAFPVIPLEFETSYHEPKVGSQSEPIY